MDLGTVVGIVSLGLQVTQGILDYYDTWDGYEDDVRQAYQCIAELSQTFGLLETRLQSISPGDFPARVLECLTACTDGLERLEKKLKKLHKEDPKGVAQRTHSGILRAIYPFRASTLEKLKEIVRDLMSHLGLAIQILLLHNSAQTGDTVAQIAGNVDGVQSLIADIQTTSLETKAATASVAAGVRTLLSDAEAKRLREIVEWLDAPDQSIDHAEARRKHEPGTGQWFLDSRHYLEWLSNPSSRLWLNGKAGCCKTVLCSTVVEDVKCRLSGQAGTVLAYFYFSFADMRKQSYHSLLLSLVTELVKDCSILQPSISTAFDRRRKPETRVLEEALIDLLRRYNTSYVLVDALDECPESGDERELVMHGLGRIAKTAGDIRLIVTSRKESDIEEFMQTWTDVEVAIEEQRVNNDIDVFIKAALVTDPKLKRLPDAVKAEIENAFHENSDGMFRWAALQLQSIRSLKIPRASYISAALHTMPRSLDETYTRILAAIDEMYHDEVRVALQWLTFSEAPLSVAEVAEACSIRLDDVNNEDLLDECNEETIAGLLSVISPLVLVEQLSFITDDHEGMPATMGEPLPEKYSAARRAQRIRLAHFTVKEYLLSTRLQSSQVSQFSLSADSYYDLAQTCCAYFINFTNRSEIQKWIEEERPPISQQAGEWGSIDSQDYLDDFSPSYPLLPHAVRLWPRYQTLAESQPIIPQSGLSLHLDVIRSEMVRVSWLRLGGYDNTHRGPDHDPKYWHDGTNALYWAAFLRLNRTISILDEREYLSDINRICGVYGTAIQAAAYSGAESTVRFLIDKGADVNLRAGKYGTALHAAADMGHEKIVEMLIHANADGTDGHALKAASTKGHEKIVQLLVNNDATADVRLGVCDNGILGACAAGYEKIVQILLTIEHINACFSCGGDVIALQAASSGGYEGIVRMLLSKNADPNLQGGYFGNALLAASFEGHENIVEMLLSQGADPNVPGGALQDAISAGNKNIVEMLLLNGANPNIQAGSYGSALQCASSKGDESIVQMLLAHGAEVDAQGGSYNTALVAASLQGHEKVVRMLLAKGADTNIQGGHYGNALYASLDRGNEEIVRLLLENGADVNTCGPLFENVLEAASQSGYERIVLMLLDNNAMVTSNAIMAASDNGNEKIVQMLLERSTGISLHNGLWMASREGHCRIVQMLLDSGADPNEPESRTDSPLEEAAYYGHEDIFQILLDHGADVTEKAARGALTQGQDNILNILLQRGAEIDVHWALEVASSWGLDKVLQLLLDKYAEAYDVDVLRGHLQEASRAGHDACIQILSARCASLEKALGKDPMDVL